MADKNKRNKQAKLLRLSRKIHRTLGAFLFIFFFVIAVTGVMLGWKNHSGGLILAKTPKGSSTDLKNWLPIDSLHKIACKSLHEAVSNDLSLKLNRIDIRKDKGIVKFIFDNHYWGVHLDGATGKLLQVESRRSDFIENIHDGSILDFYLGTSSDQIKLTYTSIMGVALLGFTVTGFWLWYGPKRMRKSSSKKSDGITN